MYYLINVQDNEENLKNNSELPAYRDAKNNKQLFRVWHDTYQCEAAARGLFEDDIQPYHIGKNKFSVKNLAPINNDEIKKKYNEFATILRRHNVGAKENAFDKLVNLFLAKIVDETNNPDNLHFYWKGAAYDDDLFRKLTQEKDAPQAPPKYPSSRITNSEDGRFLHDHEGNGRSMQY